MNKTFTSLIIGALVVTSVASVSPVLAKDGGREKEDNRGRGNSSFRIQDNRGRQEEKKLLQDVNFNFRLLEDNDRLRIRVPRGTNDANAQAFIAAVRQANNDFIAAIRLARTNFINAVKAARAAYLTPTTTPSNTAPTIVTAATANPAVTTGSSTNLSVLGADNGGEASLVYTWTTVGKPSAASNPVFSVNGTNGAKNTTASLSATGTYQFQVTITDANSLTVVSPVVSVTVNPVVSSNSAPTIVTAAFSNPATVTGTNSQLSVLGADDGGENNLTYTWSTVSKPPTSSNPTFSVNGTNSAKNTTATFSSAGTYQFQVMITDTGLLSVTSLVTVVVNPTVTNVTVSPSVASMNTSSTLQLTASAFDQFNALQASAFTWSIFEGILGGSVSATGLYTPSTTPGIYHVIGASNLDLNKKATSTVTVN